MLLGLLLLACEAEAPDACERMCVSAEALYGGCLEDWGAGWDAAGFQDHRDFLDACETWGWEMRLLEADAVKRGELEQEGAVDRLCSLRYQQLSDPEAVCADYTGMDWNAVPWHSEEDGSTP